MSWIPSSGWVWAEVRWLGVGEPPRLSSSERPEATGHRNLSRGEGSGSDSASPAWPGEGRSVVGAAFPWGLFRFPPGLEQYLLGLLAEFAPQFPSVE